PRQQRWPTVAGDLGTDHVGGVAVLLRPRDPYDVDARGAGACPGAARQLQSGPGAGGVVDRHARIRDSGRAIPERGHGGVFDLRPLEAPVRYTTFFFGKNGVWLSAFSHSRSYRVRGEPVCSSLRMGRRTDVCGRSRRPSGPRWRATTVGR